MPPALAPPAAFAGGRSRRGGRAPLDVVAPNDADVGGPAAPSAPSAASAVASVEAATAAIVETMPMAVMASGEASTMKSDEKSVLQCKESKVHWVHSYPTEVRPIVLYPLPLPRPQGKQSD